jgi:cytosine/adenosine deaminase-related metal-dependent hydrolase
MVVEQHEGRVGGGIVDPLLTGAGLHDGRRVESGNRDGTLVRAETQGQQPAVRRLSLDGRPIVPGCVESHTHRDEALTVTQGENRSGTRPVVAETRTAVSLGDQRAPVAVPGP